MYRVVLSDLSRAISPCWGLKTFIAREKDTSRRATGNKGRDRGEKKVSCLSFFCYRFSLSCLFGHFVSGPPELPAEYGRCPYSWQDYISSKILWISSWYSLFKMLPARGVILPFSIAACLFFSFSIASLYDSFAIAHAKAPSRGTKKVEINYWFYRWSIVSFNICKFISINGKNMKTMKSIRQKLVNFIIRN